MGVITLDQAAPAMVLAAPVKDRAGRLLVREGTELSDRHLESLRMWGISHIEIEGAAPEVSDSEPVDPALVSEAEKAVAKLLGNNDLTHPFMNALSQYCVERKVRSLQSDRAPGTAPGEEANHGS